MAPKNIPATSDLSRIEQLKEAVLVLEKQANAKPFIGEVPNRVQKKAILRVMFELLENIRNALLEGQNKQAAALWEEFKLIRETEYYIIFDTKQDSKLLLGKVFIGIALFSMTFTCFQLIFILVKFFIG